MSVAERNAPSIEYIHVPLDYPDGTKTRLLFRLVGLSAPRIYTVCIVVDCSDSYRDGIKELGALRRAIAPFPANWPVHFFKLSNTELVATQTIAEFCYGEAQVERVLENELSEIPSQFRGSFLRPCVESIIAIRSTELHPTDRLVFVLSDGQFTDFRPILPPDWMTLRVVSNSPPANGVSHFEHLKWGTNQLLGFVNKHVPQFDHEIPISVKGAPAETRFFSFSERRLREWAKPGEWMINATQSATVFFIDCEPEQASELTWWIRRDGELTQLSNPVEGSFSDAYDLRAAINRELCGIQQTPSFKILFESETGCSSHDVVQRFFEAAEALAGLRKRWTSSGLCDRLLEFTQSLGGRHDAQPDAVLVMAAQSNEGLGPDQVTAIGLSKTSVLRINSNESLGRFTVVAPFRMSFDRERRRWLISIDGGNDLELGISSQMIQMPLTHRAGDVRVLFARPER